MFNKVFILILFITNITLGQNISKHFTLKVDSIYLSKNVIYGTNNITEYYRNKKIDSLVFSLIKSDTSDSKCTTQGKLFLTQNTVAFRGFDNYLFPKKITWNESPFQSSTWTWSLQRLLLCEYLLSYSITQNDKSSLRKAEDIALNWIETNQKEDFSNGAWHDHATCLRLRAFIKLFEYGRLNGTSSQTLNKLLNAIYIHEHVLLQPDFYNRHNNHGMDQSLSLLLASLYLPELKDSKRIRDTALFRLKDEITFALTSEGVHIENSPSYHSHVINLSTLGNKIVNYYSRNNLFENFDTLINGALKFITYMTVPNNTVPLFGDSEEQTVSFNNEYICYKKLPAFNEYLYSVSEGKLGQKPAHKNGIFPKSGYAFIRNAWYAKEQKDSTIYFGFRCGFQSKFHRHDDDLSFIIWAFGEDWIIDAGKFNYNEKDSIRQYFRKANAHNITNILTEIPRRNIELFGKSKIIDYTDDSIKTSIRAISGMYEKSLITRQIEYNNLSTFEIFDTIRNKQSNARLCTMLHFPLNKKIKIIANYVFIQSNKNNKIMVVDLKNTKYDSIRVVSGNTGNYIQGWYSPILNKLYKSYALECYIKRPQNTVHYSISFLKDNFDINELKQLDNHPYWGNLISSIEEHDKLLYFETNKQTIVYFNSNKVAVLGWKKDGFAGPTEQIKKIIETIRQNKQ